jgi:hypothetical protein
MQYNIPSTKLFAVAESVKDKIAAQLPIGDTARAVLGDKIVADMAIERLAAAESQLRRERAEAARMGISLFDVALAIEEDDISAKLSVRKWVDSKKLTAKAIGKCPRDGRARLYRLSEVMADLKKILGLTRSEQARISNVVIAKLRLPVGEKSREKM